MSGHGNISVFVPHIGCPHKCSFCNQFLITGQIEAPTVKDVKEAVITAIQSKGYDPKNTELAFFGGSFTAIDRDYMLSLLKAGYTFVKDGKISGIRISTRPDAINNEILEILKTHSVTAIELGCQSMVDSVLSLNDRGHTVTDVLKAAELIKEKGFSLGMQMMTGLYGDTDEGAITTAKMIANIGCNTVRIYPTIVFKGTKLHNLYKGGKYAPQSLESAVELTAKLLKIFEDANIKVIRTGLHTLDEQGMVAGPWHPAFGELCESKKMLNQVLEIIKIKKIPKGNIVIKVPKGYTSKMVGQKKANVEILAKIGYNVKVLECSKNRVEIEYCE